MKTCLKCDHIPIADCEKYCPNCGSKDLAVSVGGNSDGFSGGEKATKADRAKAFLIDLVIMNLVGALTIIIPIIPAILVILYQLLRDTNGIGIGKRIIGLKVASQFALPATARQCILRNVPFVLPALALFIPGLGFFANNAVAFFIFAAEAARLSYSGNRFGDGLAGTTVVRVRKTHLSP